MNFREATDRLTACVTLDAIADEFGVALNTIARGRMDTASPHARTAPPDWQPVVARMAREREKAFRKLAEQLEGKA